MNTSIIESSLVPVGNLQAEVANLIKMDLIHPTHIVFKTVCVGGDNPENVVTAEKAYDELSALYNSVKAEMAEVGLWREDNNAEDALARLEEMLFSSRLAQRVNSSLERYRISGATMSYLVELHFTKTKQVDGSVMFSLRVVNTVHASTNVTTVQGFLEVCIHDTPVVYPTADLSRLN